MSRYQYNEAATVPAINAELEKIQEAIEDSLSRSGDTPNTMTAPLDMNGERIMNLPEAVSDSEPMRKGEAQPFVDAAAASATAALQSEQAAAASASSASASASSASADASAAEELIDELNSLYLGAFNSNPATDNEGNALVKGVLYYNNVLNEIYVFNGLTWALAASQQTATDAASSAFQAANSAAAALASQNAASTSASQASASATAASTSSTQASGFAASASDSLTAAQTSATNASGSATSAASSATAALNSANAASDSEDAASVSETNAASSASAAAGSATSASNSASAASTSATNAAGSATAAATSATNAASSATSASGSASAASTSAANALLSEQAADAAVGAAEDARDEAVAYASAFSKGLIFIGVYDASVGSFPTLPDPLIGNPFWIINVAGTISGTSYDGGDTLIYDSTAEAWIKLDTTDRVVSVAGKVGAVTLVKADVGLSNVDNTSDLSKPISTATQTALDGKANTVHSHVISDVTGLQSALDAKVDDSQLATAATANSVAQRTSDGSLNVTDLNAVDVFASGNVGVGTSSPSTKVYINDTNTSPVAVTINNGSAATSAGGKVSFAFNGSETGYVLNQFDGVDFNNIYKSNRYHLFLTGAAERMRIDSSGNVGIGTSSPNAKLEAFGGNVRSALPGASDSVFRGVEFAVDTTVIGSIKSQVSTGEMRIDAGFSGFGGYSTFLTNGAERMRIGSSGNVAINSTNTSGAKLRVAQSAEEDVISVNIGQFAAALSVGSSTSTMTPMYMATTSGGAGQITCSGNTTTYSTSSDYRLKEDWQPMQNSIDRLMQLKPCNFAWKTDGSRVDGFLAHEAQEVVPEAVTGEKDAVRTEQYEVEPAVYEDVVIPAEFDEEGNEISPERTEQKLVSEAVMGEREVPQYQGIDQAKLVPLLTAALQDAIKKIEALEARIEALEGN